MDLLNMQLRRSEQPVMLEQSRISSQEGKDLEVMYKKLHQLQARLSRSLLSEAIKEFEENLQCLFHEAKLLLCTKRTKYRQSWFGSSNEFGPNNESKIIKAACRIIESTNTILNFLSFLEKKRGMPSGGDQRLQQAAYKGQQFALRLLRSLTIHKDAQEIPGKEFGMTYGKEVYMLDGHILRRSKREVVGQAGGVNWHVDHTHHPLRRVPGTPWHKFFGNLEVDDDQRLHLFDDDTSAKTDRNGLRKFSVIIPETAEFFLDEISSEHQQVATIHTEDGHAQPPVPTPIQQEAGYVAAGQPEVVFHHGGLRQQIVDYSQERQFSTLSNVFTRPAIWGESLDLADDFDPREGVQQEEHVYHI
ncbi:putative mat-A2 protein [Pseudoneurospora amorphoporcata]|uniref:Mat-A2 protein n=1 Tax=Pseudoneurospora amorphoporcata TaxID=241081 RepID=A0AAN6SIU5_9PEZI|nr:putative mat-A2 protein [Pseudoneurospora amorphoporcata]